MMGPAAVSKGFERGGLVKIRTRLSWPGTASSFAFQDLVGKIGTIIEITVDIHLSKLKRDERALVLWENNDASWVPVRHLETINLN